jgi:hypothetical protein
MPFFTQGAALRFYVEGYEVDVQDPAFFMDEIEDTELNKTLDEMLEDYVADIRMVKY